MTRAKREGIRQGKAARKEGSDGGMAGRREELRGKGACKGK